MQRGRKQRNHYLLIGLSLATLLLADCGSRNSSSDDELYLQATAGLRRGDFMTAQRLAERGSEVWRDQPQSPLYWKYRIVLAEALTNLGRSKDALPLLETRPPEHVDFAESHCRSKTVLAKAYLRLGRPKDAASTLDESDSCAASWNLKALAPENQMVRYAVLETLNRPQEAETALRSGLKFAEEQDDTYWQTVALNNLGMRRVRGLRYDEAIPFLTRAEEGFQKIDAKVLASFVQVNIALCAYRLGDFDKALATYASAIEVQEREGARPYLQATLGEVGNFHMVQGDFTNAIPYYQRALALALEISALSDASKWAGNLASAMTNVRNWDQAETFNQQAHELKQRLNDVDSQTHTMLYSAVIAAGRGQRERAEKLYRDLIKAAAGKPSILWEAHAGLGQVYRTTGDNKRASEQFESALEVIEASQAELTLPEHKITYLARLIRFYQDYIDALIDWGEDDKALQVAESSRARVLAERLGRGRTAQRVSAPADYSRAARQSKTVFLSYWLAAPRSFLWVVTPQTRKLFVLPPREEVEPLVKSYLAFVRNLRDPLESGPPAAEKLYDILLKPARELIPQGAKVVVVPDGALHNLNFEMLPVPASTPHYWIEDVVLSVAPSMAVRPDVDSGAGLKSILLIGNPESAGEPYPKLPNAGDEMRSVERRMGALQKTVYEGAQAGPAVYRASKPEQFSVIHFAAHASANNESPMESAIILSPSENTFKLYARDVAQVPLQAELVTISACRGAGARVYSGEGLVGFTWAFLQAGARHVIAGLWDVTDRSTAQLMDRLYESLSAGKSPAQALRDAKLAMIRSDGNFRKPYYWGPFQVYIGSAGRKNG